MGWLVRTDATTLLSLDIDGTLEVGDPPGPVTLDAVRHAIALGFIVGSASDRVVSFQTALWAQHGITVDFVGHKHQLDALVSRYPQVTRRLHVGDTDVDQRFAHQHDFEFCWQYDWPPNWLRRQGFG